jgi:hypothetical protein
MAGQKYGRKCEQSSRSPIIGAATLWFLRQLLTLPDFGANSWNKGARKGKMNRTGFPADAIWVLNI